MKESEDPESTRVFRIVLGRESEVRARVRDSGLERAATLSVACFTQGSSAQSSGRAKSRGLLSLFRLRTTRLWCAARLWCRRGCLCSFRCPSFRGRRRGLVTVLGEMSVLATEQTEVLVETALSFLRRQLAIFSELGRIIIIILLWVGRFSFALVRAGF